MTTPGTRRACGDSWRVICVEQRLHARSVRKTSQTLMHVMSGQLAQSLGAARTHTRITARTHTPPCRVALIIISRRRATDTRRQSHISLPTPHTATCAIVNAVMGARGGAGVSRARTRDPPHAPVQRDARCAHRRRVERTTVAAAARRHRALCPSTPVAAEGV